MSQENLEILRRFAEVFETGDLDRTAVRDGRTALAEEYFDRDEALEAVGVRE